MRAYFARTLKVDICPSWGFGKDAAYLQRNIGIEDPNIKVDIIKAK